MSTKNVYVEFGLVADPIAKQLADQGIVAPNDNYLERWQKAIDSQNFLRVCGFLPPSHAHLVDQRILREICKTARSKP